jgi:hypothetical protein
MDERASPEIEGIGLLEARLSEVNRLLGEEAFRVATRQETVAWEEHWRDVYEFESQFQECAACGQKRLLNDPIDDDGLCMNCRRAP